MGLFRYWALDPQGKRFTGIVNADSLQQAKDQLQHKRVLVTKIAVYQAKAARLTLAPALLLDFTRGMATLLKAGLPLYEALHILKEKHHRSKLSPLLLGLSEQIKHGRHISKTFASYPKIFSPIYLAMIRAGEESGTLAESFEKLFSLIEKEQKMKKKLISSLMYPLFLSLFSFGVLGMLFFFLVPSLRDLLEGSNLHPITKWVLATSDTLNRHGTSFLIATVCFVVGLTLFFRSDSGKKIFHLTLYKLPLAHSLITQGVLARFCRVFSLLLCSDVPLIQSLSLAKRVMKQVIFEQAIERAEQAVLSGGKLSEALQQSKEIPLVLARMIALGEEAGNLGPMMAHIAAIYEDDVDKSLLRMTALLQPVMLLLMGLIVAVVLLAVLLPLTDMSALT